MRIDAHQHFWRYSTKDYGWITDRMENLRRDYLPEHLEIEIRNAGLDGVICVQARQSIEETKWLLELPDQHDLVKGVVGWVPLVSPQVRQELEVLSFYDHLKGVRHVLQDEEDNHFMLRTDFNEGVSALKDLDLVYDILIYERHLPQTVEFVDRHPRQVFVLDHIAKPRIKDGLLSPWRENIHELARRPNVYCKLSGMVTEADWRGWSEEALKPYFETVLEAFGPRRLMFGSDWPVCLLACGYQKWCQTVSNFTATLSSDEQARIFGGTAAEAYRL